MTCSNTTINTTDPVLAAPSSAVDFPSTLNGFPGGFEFCVALNCNIHDGSFSVTLGRLGTDAFLNSDSELECGFVTTNFSSSTQHLVSETPSASSSDSSVSPSPTSSSGGPSLSVFKSLFLSVPFDGGDATRLNYTAFNDGSNSTQSTSGSTWSTWANQAC